MLRKIMISFVVIFSISQTNATEKNKIDLDRTFWGTWELINTKFACTEQYEFKKPGNVVYQANKKKLTGEFAVIRHNDSKTLDSDFKINFNNNNYSKKKTNQSESKTAHSSEVKVSTPKSNNESFKKINTSKTSSSSSHGGGSHISFYGGSSSKSTSKAPTS